MLTNTPLATHTRRPACGRCGGTGFVYLWSTARVGTRVWFCDRPTCKQFWSDDGGWSVTSLGNEAVVLHELQPLVANADGRVPQPV